MAASRNMVAAQYLRMSTEGQQYSLGNQADAIAGYAAAEELDRVATYEDGGNAASPLESAMVCRLSCVTLSGSAQFGVVLGLDVVR
ncbi:recombinase family protein [Brevundimonas sp. GCM10030266]|uniref:recombinase family protein n=1 Tax=Brevundimonas sp. GCM10030266 TaxID=3273386 RepID=UPI00361EB4DA